MKKLVCGCFGTIYYATILKNGLMSSSDRVDVTDDAINAVVEHLLAQSEYADKGCAGYKWVNEDDNSKIRLVAYDTTKYKLYPINEIGEK